MTELEDDYEAAKETMIAYPEAIGSVPKFRYYWVKEHGKLPYIPDVDLFKLFMSIINKVSNAERMRRKVIQNAKEHRENPYFIPASKAQKRTKNQESQMRQEVMTL